VEGQGKEDLGPWGDAQTQDRREIGKESSKNILSAISDGVRAKNKQREGKNLKPCSRWPNGTGGQIQPSSPVIIGGGGKEAVQKKVSATGF